jgi:hypothetical protein
MQTSQYADPILFTLNKKIATGIWLMKIKKAVFSEQER